MSLLQQPNRDKTALLFLKFMLPKLFGRRSCLMFFEWIASRFNPNEISYPR
jgi:hypothetical protein